MATVTVTHAKVTSGTTNDAVEVDLADWNDGHVVTGLDDVRDILTSADRHYYVRSDGSDSNTGLTDTAAGAFLTIQKAASVLHDSLDLGAFKVFVNVGAGTFAGAAFTGPTTGGGGGGAGPVVLLGSGAANTTINSTIIAKDYARIQIGSLKVTVASGSNILVQTHSNVFLYDNDVELGPAVDSLVNCSVHSSFRGQSTYGLTISGGATYGFLILTNSSVFLSVGATYTITGTPAFPSGFVCAINNSSFNPGWDSVFVGSATGVRYNLANSSIVDMENITTELPGDSAGTVTWGSGFYATNALDLIGVGDRTLQLIGSSMVAMPQSSGFAAWSSGTLAGEGSAILPAANGGTGVANAYTITLVGSNLSVTPRGSGQWPIWSAGSLTGGTSTTLTNAAAPSSPSAGSVTIWNDSTDLRFHDKNSAGTIGTTVVADAGASNNFLTAISAAGVVSKAQPAFTNISGTATVAQGGTGQTTEAEAIGELIQALTEDTTPDWSADYFGSYDASADTGKKIKLSTVTREILAANRTYYVRADGSDSNTGLANTSGGAFLTIQKAIDIAVALDLSIYEIIIQVAAGTYTGAITTKPYIGTGPISILGDTTTPSNCAVSVASNSAFRFTNRTALYVVKGFQVSTTTSGFSFYATSSNLQYGNMVFGATPAGFAHIYLDGQSNITATANYEITTGPYAHIQADYGSTATISSRTITLTGTPAFSAGFIYATRAAIVAAVSDTFSGSATGPYYLVNKNAVIDTGGGGATYLPGNSAGSSASGGQYV